MPFAVPMMWTEQKENLTDCYFCLDITDGRNWKSKHTTVYPNIPSALRPAEHEYSQTIFKPPQQWTLHEKPTTPLQKMNLDLHVVVWMLISWNELYFILYHSMNLIIWWGTSRSRTNRQNSTSRLQGWKFYSRVLNCHTGNTSNCHHFFPKDGRSAYCNDVGLPQVLG
jgi:hypothetical protein